MNKSPEKQDPGATARRVLEIESRAIRDLAQRIGASFNAAFDLCLNCEGRVVVTGMGKSGHIAGKLAATLASTWRTSIPRRAPSAGAYASATCTAMVRVMDHGRRR